MLAFGMLRASVVLVALAVLAPAHALAWGNSGHRMIGSLAAESLPDSVPAFLRKPAVIAEIGELSREPDRSRGAGKVHDGMRDPAHFIDIDDEGKVLGGPDFRTLPPTMADYETALRAAGTDSVKAGYLSYAIIDGWQQLTKDFALWRVGVYGEATEKDRRKRAWLRADRKARERLIIRDLGTWSHYVGDASYPPHVSVHYNGWGDYPNPQGFTTARIHVPLEGPFVARNVTVQAVRGRVNPLDDCNCPIEARVTRYLEANHAQVEPFYRLEKDGGFREGDPRGVAFMTRQLAIAASEVRDMVADAWDMSETMKVGYPAVTLADIKAGKITPYAVLYSAED